MDNLLRENLEDRLAVLQRSLMNVHTPGFAAAADAAINDITNRLMLAEAEEA